MAYKPLMAKENAIGVRFEPEEREALARAAKSDDRSQSALIRRITVEWLRREGWMPEQPK